MLPPKVISLMDECLAVFDLENSTNDELRKAQRRAAEENFRAGTHQSESWLLRRLAPKVIAVIERRAEYAWSKLREIIIAVELQCSESLSSDLMSEISRHVSPALEQAQVLLERNTPRADLRATEEAVTKCKNVLRKINTEIQLFCAGLASKQRPQQQAPHEPKTVINVNSFKGHIGDVTNSHLSITESDNPTDDPSP